MPQGVQTLLGDPKRAIIRLALPMIAAFSLQTIYNFVDAIWVAGLGPDALAAVGFFFPFYFIALAIGLGIGTGGGAAISRRIGARDREGAGRVGSHTFILMLLSSLALAIPFFIFAEPLFQAIGAGGTTGLVVAYGQILFAATPIIFLTSVGNAILRAEGDARRAMYAMVFGAVLNIVLDPIFIYTLGLGVAGAAWATVVSLAATSVLMVNWLFLRRDTYVHFAFRGFRFEGAILRDILRVGLPASVMFLTMSFAILTLNLIVVSVDGTDGVAVMTAGWRVLTLAHLPVFGLSTAVVSVIGASYGARAYGKLKIAYLYGIRLGLYMEVPAAIAIFFLAGPLAGLFTWSAASAGISEDIIAFLLITALSIPFMAIAVPTSTMFQGTGRGSSALLVTLFRTVILMPPLAYLFATSFGLGLTGVWWGILAATTLGAAVAFTWGRAYVNALVAAEGARSEEGPTEAP
ncbi:MAG: MATE family efflux transporter [Candidatus Thermoplasmatota archaeon]|nr:MATE family efflux transporter [Candidatus Thermoplasmatota archaeon]